MATARVTDPAECSRWVYCGAPYYLPVLSLVSTGHALPAEAPPLTEVVARVATAPLDATTQLLVVNVTGAPSRRRAGPRREADRAGRLR